MLKKLIRSNQRRIRFNICKNFCCPDCNEKVYWDDSDQVFRCSNDDCDFTCDKDGFLISLNKDDTKNLF